MTSSANSAPRDFTFGELVEISANSELCPTRFYTWKELVELPASSELCRTRFYIGKELAELSASSELYPTRFYILRVSRDSASFEFCPTRFYIWRAVTLEQVRRGHCIGVWSRRDGQRRSQGTSGKEETCTVMFPLTTPCLDRDVGDMMTSYQLGLRSMAESVAYSLTQQLARLDRSSKPTNIINDLQLSCSHHRSIRRSGTNGVLLQYEQNLDLPRCSLQTLYIRFSPSLIWKGMLFSSLPMDIYVKYRSFRLYSDQ
ncbi:hypothetical protein Acr_21g0007080 [Actinidia rufa]|uniref:Uncharacterized protein n=1 Tax=Actinidia rufa TaxID=165716 RepID=A0A7J0GH20_9ERIC|nr:hypothetical protein Acr_21g0007080 [Actinidia rufa]